MNAHVAHLWRHPIKGIGTEPLDRVTVEKNRPFPLDRAWAVYEEGRAPQPGWQRCANFLRGAKGPSLMAITARTEGDNTTFTHPDRPALTLSIREDAQSALFEWLRPIYPDNRPAPAKLVRAPQEGMADAPFASVSIMNQATRRALSQKAGREMDMRRFRGNIWMDGLAPWEEFDLIGKTLTVGTAELEVVERITRCRATEANPDTGQRDTATLDILQDTWGHTDFGVYAKVVKGGQLALGDDVTWN